MTSETPHRPSTDGTQGQIDWNSVLAEHRSWLRSVIGARLGEPQAVDEVLQEVSLAAVRQRSPIQDVEKIAPWLYRLAVRQTLMYRRKRGRNRKLIEHYARRYGPEEADPEPDPLGWLLADERKRLIREAISRLAPRDREILLLKYVQDWSYREMAEHIGVSESAVESRLFRARNKLRKELAVLELATTDG